MGPKISVIIPVYKVEKYLEKCLDSVVNQTYRNLEIIIIDDGSPDRCGEICDAYAKSDDRIQVIHKENGGLSAARNDALKIVTGTWISFVDSDDWCELNMYERAIKKAEKTNADLVIYSLYRNMYDKEEQIHSFPEEFETQNKDFIYKLQLSTLVNKYSPFPGGQRWIQGFPWDKLYKASLILDNNLVFPENVEANEDVIFNIHAFQFARSIVFFDEPLYHWRLNPTSIGHKYTPDRVEVDKEIFDEYISIGEKYHLPDSYKKAIYTRMVSNNIVALGNRCFFHKENKDSFRNKIKSAKMTLESEPFATAFQEAEVDKLSQAGRLLLRCKVSRAWALYAISKIYQVLKRT